MNSWDAPDPDSPRTTDGVDPHPTDGVSGRAVVLGMLGFGVLATAGLWLYWELHSRPFRPLAQALVREFPGSNPRVQGGQAKMHKGTPRILRIVMRVGFDPVSDESEAQRTAERAAELARQHHDVTAYETIEVGLFQPLAEADPRMVTVRFPVGATARLPD